MHLEIVPLALMEEEMRVLRIDELECVSGGGITTGTHTGSSASTGGGSRGGAGGGGGSQTPAGGKSDFGGGQSTHIKNSNTSPCNPSNGRTYDGHGMCI